LYPSEEQTLPYVAVFITIKKNPIGIISMKVLYDHLCSDLYDTHLSWNITADFSSLSDYNWKKIGIQGLWNDRQISISIQNGYQYQAN
jgi:hypothetical protein